MTRFTKAIVHIVTGGAGWDGFCAAAIFWSKTVLDNVSLCESAQAAENISKIVRGGFRGGKCWTVSDNVFPHEECPIRRLALTPNGSKNTNANPAIAAATVRMSAQGNHLGRFLSHFPVSERHQTTPIVIMQAAMKATKSVTKVMTVFRLSPLAILFAFSSGATLPSPVVAGIVETALMVSERRAPVSESISRLSIFADVCCLGGSIHERSSLEISGKSAVRMARIVTISAMIAINAVHLRM